GRAQGSRRKRDVQDRLQGECLACRRVTRHGLIPASFIPPAPIRELRALTPHRNALVQQRPQEGNRREKVRDGATRKRTAVATSRLGKRARDILDALLAGAQDMGRWPTGYGGAGARS